MRRVTHSVFGEHRERMGHLDWRERVIALPDSGRDRVAEIPLLLLATEALLLPGSRRQHPGDLALDVDAGRRAESELAQETRGVVDLGLVREHVVVGVARHDERLVHVDPAVTTGTVGAQAG